MSYLIWAGGKHAPNQDIAGLFFTRCVDLYLRYGGVAAMVLPHSALQTGAYAKWRQAKWGRVIVDLAERPPWDLEQITPNDFFPVPGCVVFAEKLADSALSRRFVSEAVQWRGALGGPYVHTLVPLVDNSGDFASPYGDRSRKGADVYPRALFLVNLEEPRSTVRAANTVTVSPRRTSNDNEPWATIDLSDLGSKPTEADHVWNVHLGETVVPYVVLEPLKAVLPLSRKTGELVEKLGGIEGLDPGHLGDRMRRRWRLINQIWDQNKSADNDRSLLENIDYHNKLRTQRARETRSLSRIRVVYAASGRPTASVVEDEDAIIDHTLYWIPCATIDEAEYLAAVINSRTLEEAVAPFMPKGQFGGRHTHKHLWRLPIPLFDPADALHREIAAAAAATTRAAAEVLRESRATRDAAGKSTAARALRADIRAWLAESKEGQEVERLVAQLLGDASASVTEGG